MQMGFNRRPGALALLCSLASAAAVRAEEAPAAGSTTPTLMEEVTVTARRRAENLQDTPISIAAFSGAALEARGVERADELARVVPNLVFQGNPGAGGSASNAAVFIRGVGQADFIPTIDPGVGLYIDGVYVARSVGGLMDLVDIERIEVLRGPQGTLFGRNTIGGAVSITTQKPEFELGARSSLLLGTDDRLEVKGRLNIPLSSSFAASLAAARVRQDGYVDETATGQDLGDRDSLVGKLALRWRGERTEANFAADVTRTRENGPAFVLRGVDFRSAIFNPGQLPLLPPGSGAQPGFYTLNPPADVPVDNFSLFHNYLATLLTHRGNCLGLGSATYTPEGDQTNPACFGSQYAGEASGTNSGNLRSISDDDLWGAHLTFDWQLSDAVRLKSISAYRHLNSTFQRDGDESPLTIFHLIDQLTQHQFSQELQLEGESLAGVFKWVGGVYYFDEQAANPNIVDFAPVTALSGGESATSSVAGFAQATYDVNSKLALTAGVRYTRDRKTFLPQQRVLDNKGGPFPIGLPLLPEMEVSGTFSKFTPLLNAAYHLTPDTMAYATFSQGFKSGGFTQRVFPPLPATPSFDPETVTAYEIGMKTSAWDNRLHVNAAAYRTHYDDIQVQIFREIAPITDNGGAARVQGFELEAQAAPGAGWFLEANVGLTDAEYTSISATAVELSLDKKFAFVSRWTGLAAIQKELDLAGAGRISPRVEWSYRTRYFNDALNTAATEQPGYGLLNGSVQWTSTSSKFSATAGVKNAADQNYIVAAFFTPGSGVLSVIPARGREWYVSLKADF